MVEERHARRVIRVQDQLRCYLEAKDSRPLGQLRRGSVSNVTRTSRRKDRYLLDLRPLNHVLEVDTTERLAIVEPGVTMQALVKATVRHGLLPQVTPEFRGITVGGAISGAGIESSAHKFGLFHDTVAWCELLLGSGELRRLSPSEHSHLFAGISGAYGSLGMVLCASLRLIPSMPYVRVLYEHHSSAADALSSLREKALKPDPPCFLDGLVISPHKSVVMSGWLSQRTSLPLYRSKASWAVWFHAHAADSRGEELIPLEDYLFRYDRAAFWMGQYSLMPKPSSEKTWEMLCQAQRTLPYVRPGLCRRLTTGWALSSQRLYRRLHSFPDDQVARTFLIQDLCVPLSQATSFVEEVQARYAIYPLWLCPTRRAPNAQILSPHHVTCSDELLVNVGVYGVPSTFSSAIHATSDLEACVALYGGRKALYSHSYYTIDRFWELYDRKAYEHLRESSFAIGVFPSITDKVLRS